MSAGDLALDDRAALIDTLPIAFRARLFVAIERIRVPQSGIAELVDVISAALRELFSCDAVSYGEIDPRRRSLRVSWPVQRADLPSLLSRFLALTRADPRWKGPPDLLPRRMSDMISDADLGDWPIYREVFRPLGGRRSIEFAVQVMGGRVRSFTLIRDGHRDFSDAALAGVLAIRPYVTEAFEALSRRRWHEAVPAVAADLPLTARQREIGEWLLAGKSHEEMALILGLSRETVKLHLSGLYRRLGVHGRVGAALRLAGTAPGFLVCPGCYEPAGPVANPPIATRISPKGSRPR